jgi:hypothetical protein
VILKEEYKKSTALIMNKKIGLTLARFPSQFVVIHYLVHCIKYWLLFFFYIHVHTLTYTHRKVTTENFPETMSGLDFASSKLRKEFFPISNTLNNFFLSSIVLDRIWNDAWVWVQFQFIIHVCLITIWRSVAAAAQRI